MRLLSVLSIFALLTQPALAAERSATFSISNMTCALCPITVKAAMSRVEGVKHVDVSQKLAQATVSYDDAVATADAIAAAATNAGYPATLAQTK